MKPLESLLRTFTDLHPEDAARAIEVLDEPDVARLLKTLPLRTAATLLERLATHSADAAVERLPPERAARLLQEMAPRAAGTLLHRIDADSRGAIVDLLSDGAAKSLEALGAYPEDTAGGMMEPRVASLPIDLTAQEAIATIRKTPRDALHYLYVTDRDRKLIGVLNMRDLLLAAPRDSLAAIVRRKVLSVPAQMDREEVVHLMRDRKFLALPVVDFDDKLVGVVKHDEALEAGQIEAFEDLQKTVGAGADERALSGVTTVVRSRLPWLYVNLGTAFLAASVVGLFEGVIARVAALAVLLPVVAGQGGNTGAQSLAVVMRGLALREVFPGVRGRVVWKEFRGGLLNGLAVALGTSLAVFAWRRLSGDSTTASAMLAVVMATAMIVTMAVAALAGAVIPLALRALGRDPAQSSSIFLTTVTDIVGFGTFLGFAALASRYLI